MIEVMTEVRQAVADLPERVKTVELWLTSMERKLKLRRKEAAEAAEATVVPIKKPAPVVPLEEDEPKRRRWRRSRDDEDEYGY